MATRETPRGVEATGFSEKKLIENCPLVISALRDLLRVPGGVRPEEG